jgi:hypothetical protein
MKTSFTTLCITSALYQGNDNSMGWFHTVENDMSHLQGEKI